jgi:hypothetical protein
MVVTPPFQVPDEPAHFSLLSFGISVWKLVGRYYP